jgi:hypothetical protein
MAAEIPRRWPKSKSKISILTLLGVRIDDARCRELNIEAHLSKPIRGSDVLQAIERLFPAENAGELVAHPSLFCRRGIYGAGKAQNPHSGGGRQPG